MGRKRHKRKNSHVVLFTSDAVEVELTQFRIRPWILQTIIVIFCVVFGVAIGYLAYGTNSGFVHISQNESRLQELEAQNVQLAEQNTELESQVLAQQETIATLSMTVNEKVQNETILAQQLEQQTTPTEFPLTGSATMEEVVEGEPMCVFTAASGSMVVATANGTVIAVNDDTEYGHNVWVDHGNGYTTVYRNQGEVKVKQGEVITRGTTLFLIGDDNNQLGYQMLKDGGYINPTDMLTISG